MITSLKYEIMGALFEPGACAERASDLWRRSYEGNVGHLLCSAVVAKPVHLRRKEARGGETLVDQG